MKWTFLACVMAFCWFLAGCVSPALPDFGAARVEAVPAEAIPGVHNGVDIEAAQGITRTADGWIQSEGKRYRVAGGMLEWEVELANVSDMPRRAAASIVAGCENYAVGAQTCLEVKDSATTIIPPCSTAWVRGRVAVPNEKIRSFSVRMIQPAASPREEGPVVIRCVSCRDGVAVIEWKATGISVAHNLGAQWKDENGRAYRTEKREVPTAYVIIAVLYGAEGVELARDRKVCPADADRRVHALGRWELPIEQAADISKVTVSWDAVPIVEQDPKQVAQEKTRTIHAEVTAYCPCAKCCGDSADGRTATNADAQLCGVAADWGYLPAGKRVLIQDYPEPGAAQWVRVDDRGGDIRGPGRFDVRFRDHQTARQWGRRQMTIQVED